MVGHEHLDAAGQRREPTRRAVILGGTLAIALACLTFVQGGAWASPDAVWMNAAHVAPSSPVPWINLALLAVQRGDLLGAERLLAEATTRADRQAATERVWANDEIAAARALVRMRQGRLREAAMLMHGALPATARGELCRHYASVCALANSPF